MLKLSVVIPFFNERENIERIYGELVAVHASELSDYALEIILMDNHSTDGSFELACELVKLDSRIKVIRLSRNFGYQANIITGYMNCTGDAVVQLDADGEDDPALIPQMVRDWRAGAKVVYGVRRVRHEGFLLTFQRKAFYRILNRLSSVEIPTDSGDFRLLDRQVVDGLRDCTESALYIRGIISYLGFTQKGFLYDRRPRFKGESKFSWWDYYFLAWDGITSFSEKPLTIVTVLGLFVSILSFIGIIVYFGAYLVGAIPVRGFTTLILIQLLMAGVQLLSLGIIGTYIGKIYRESKARPRSIVEKSVGAEGPFTARNG